MNKSILILRIALLAGGVLLAFPIHAVTRPNIIIIVADDLGYGDIGVNGCKDIPTPHIDQIAKEGVRFTQGYASAPVCAPSRAGLMCGMYSHRFGFENNSGAEKSAPANFGLPKDIPTLAEKLKAAGYSTALIGKWHLGFANGMRPTDRGFDYFYGFVGGSRSYYPHKSQNNAPLVRNGVVVNDEKEYLTDALAREAMDFIRRSSTSDSRKLDISAGKDVEVTSSEKPYFLYLAFSAVHLPMEPAERYEKRFRHIEDPKRRTYAGILSAMDDAVGRVMSALRDLGQDDNTLVFFFSDNGGPTPYTTSSNMPLRGTKGEVYEGGIRVPFLMQWPNKINDGKVYDKPVIAFDVHATALAAASVKDSSTDGTDLVPFLTGKETESPHSFLCWRFGGGKAIRMGDWKLVYPAKGETGKLYNLAEDIGEQQDLAAEQPAKLEELTAKLSEWENEMKPPAWESGAGKGSQD